MPLFCQPPPVERIQKPFRSLFPFVRHRCRSRVSFLLWTGSGLASCVNPGCDVGPDVVAKEPAPASGGGRQNEPSGLGGALLPDSGVGGATSGTIELFGDIQVHDPSIIDGGTEYFLFSTGTGIPIKTSPDLSVWQAAGRVFEALPSWIRDLLPDATDLWAPDISRFGGVYHLYYAASTFGSGRSCIGHATKEDLSSSDAWVDEGEVICSNVEGAVDWDAIDPSSLLDATGRRWLVFGSFGSGIKAIRLDEQGARLGDELHALAARPVEEAIQAPFVLYREPYYYLFATFGTCCRGVDSTSRIMMGRAEQVEGPYFDREGVPLLEGGGSLLLAGDERWRAVGANTFFAADGKTYNAYHAYDANAAGLPVLRISEVEWSGDGWLSSAGP